MADDGDLERILKPRPEDTPLSSPPVHPKIYSSGLVDEDVEDALPLSRELRQERLLLYQRRILDSQEEED